MSLVNLIPVVHKLAEIFESLRIKYAFGGALANNYWGTIRATQDIDVLLFIPPLRYEEVATAKVLTTPESGIKQIKRFLPL